MLGWGEEAEGGVKEGVKDIKAEEGKEGYVEAVI